MATYQNLPKLSRVKLPNNTTYAIVDLDGRALIAGPYAEGATYAIGDYVIYRDTLYRCLTPIASAPETLITSNWEAATVGSELKNIKSTISGGIHYRGYTTSALYDGSTENPIIIGGAAYTCASGDMVIETPPAYATNTAYHAGQYLTYIDGNYYQVVLDIAAVDNTQWTDLITKLATNKPEFLFDGTIWNEIGMINPKGFGSLAYKDSATGTYIKPTGTGSVTVKEYGVDSRKLSTTTITGTNGTLNASYITDTANTAFALADATTKTFATAANSSTRVGNADVGSEVAVGTALSGTTTFNTDAVKNVTLTGTTTFNTDAIKNATLGGTTTFATGGVLIGEVDGDCLVFNTASTGSVTISTTPASTGTVGVTSDAASTATVGLTTTDITPAKAVSETSTTVLGVGGTDTIKGVSGTANALTGITYSTVTPAQAAASAITVATGGLETGSQLVVGLTTTDAAKTVSVGTENGNVVVQ